MKKFYSLYDELQLKKMIKKTHPEEYKAWGRAINDSLSHLSYDRDHNARLERNALFNKFLEEGIKKGIVERIETEGGG